MTKNTSNTETEPNLEHLANGSLTPDYSEEDIECLKAYYEFNLKHQDKIQEKVADNLSDDPVFGPLFASFTPEQMQAQQEMSNEMLRAAIYDEKWEPYLNFLLEQGKFYAQVGLSHSKWHQLASMNKVVLDPILEKEFKDDFSGSLAVSKGLSRLADYTVLLITESFFEEKNKKIREQALEQQRLLEELQRLNMTLETRVKHRTIELERANEKLTEAQKDIQDSINYAMRIQRTILPSKGEMERLIGSNFVFYRPRDFVSGDFYWAREADGLTFIACVDCTGHGVPGALMSMIGHEMLEHIIVDRRITRPDIVLEEMDRSIDRLLKRSASVHTISDGMDVSLCVLDKARNTLSFSGAVNSAYIVSENEVKKLEAARHSIGGFGATHTKQFIRHTYEYENGEMLYLFSDGFYDQFGGPDKKKFGRKNLLQVLSEIASKSISDQENVLEQRFLDWQSDEMQIDDVTVIGVKL